MKVLVQCKFQIEVEYPEEYRDEIELIVKQDRCPGTGYLGSAIDDMIKLHHDRDTCWACGSQGQKKILSIDGVAFH